MQQLHHGSLPCFADGNRSEDVAVLVLWRLALSGVCGDVCSQIFNE